MPYGGDVGEIPQKGSNEGDDDHGGKHHAQGGNDAAGDPLTLAAHKGGGVHGDDAGGTLADGKIVRQFVLGAPAPLVHHLPLEDGKHGVAAAEGAYAHLGEHKE